MEGAVVVGVGWGGMGWGGVGWGGVKSERRRVQPETLPPALPATYCSKETLPHSGHSEPLKTKDTTRAKGGQAQRAGFPGL